MIPKLQFCIGGQFTRGMDELEIANEAASDIAEAGMVDVRCFKPDAAGIMLALFNFGPFEVALVGGEGTAKAVEGDDVFD